MTFNTIVLGGIGENALGLLDKNLQIEVFIDPGVGFDGNSGLSSDDPLRTIQGLRDKYPIQMFGDAQIVVNLAGVGGFGADATGVQTYMVRNLFVGGGESFANSYRYVGPEMVPFTPATGPSTAALDAIPAVTVDNAGAADPTANRTRFDFTTAAPGWTVDDLAGKMIRFTLAGALVYFELPISKNTADQVFVDTPGIAGGAITTPGVVAEIVTPGAEFIGPGGFNLGSVFVMGFGGNLVSGFIFGAPSMFTRIRFAGLFTGFSSIPRCDFDRCVFNLTQFRNTSIGFNNCCTDAQGMVLSRCDMDAGAGSSGTPIDPIPSVSLTVTQAPFSSFNVFQSTLFLQKNFSIWDGGSDALRADMSRIEAIAGVAIQGDGNAGVGILSRTNSEIIVQGGPLCVITGAGGDLQCMDSQPAISYGTAAGEFEEAAGYDGQFTRVLEGSAAAPRGDASRIATST